MAKPQSYRVGLWPLPPHRAAVLFGRRPPESLSAPNQQRFYILPHLTLSMSTASESWLKICLEDIFSDNFNPSGAPSSFDAWTRAGKRRRGGELMEEDSGGITGLAMGHKACLPCSMFHSLHGHSSGPTGLSRSRRSCSWPPHLP